MKSMSKLLGALAGLGLMLAVGLGGCSTASIPVYTELAGQSGEITETIAGYTSDASVAKEHEVHMTLRNRDRMYAKMYDQSGFKMSFRMVEVAPGVMALLPDAITYRDAVDFREALPMAPSVHPVWATVEGIFGTVAKYGLIGYGISELSGVLEAGYAASGDIFHGDVNSSFNTAGSTQSWTQDNSNMAIPMLPEGCSSFESYLGGKCDDL